MAVAVTADLVRQLRERTGSGMMECKKALVETEGDLDTAAELMRKQGLAKADKESLAHRGRRRDRDRHQCRRQGRRAGGDQLRNRFRGAWR